MGQINPTDKHVGSRVRMRRLSLKMSQTTLANALGISFQQVQKYEKGTNRVSASKLQQISDILEIPVSFFFEGSVNSKGRHKGRKTEMDPTRFFKDRRAVLLAETFSKLPARLQRRVVELVVAMAKEK